jgi:hypothetical protein
MLSRIALALTTSEVGRADWLPKSGVVIDTTDVTMTPFCLQLPIMMFIATDSLSRLAIIFGMYEQTGTFPIYSPNGGVFLI